jgi:hypothetical protein
MANTNAITISGSLKYAANKATGSLSTSFSADQTGDFYEQGIQTVGTSEEQLEQGDIVTIGYVAVRNMDETNYVEIGPDGTSWPVKLKPLQGCVMPWNDTEIHAKANTASCKVEYLLIEL